MRRPQHSKGKKRPGHWHQGPGLARQQIPRLDALERAEELEKRISAELADAQARGREETALWRALEHVNPPAGLELWPEWL